MLPEKFNKCLERIRSGDKRGMEDIFLEYYGKMVIAALMKVRDEDEANDIASDFLEYILVNANEIGYIECPSAWIYQSIRNRAANFIRKDSRKVLITECAEDLFIKDSDFNFHCYVTDSINELSDYEKELFSLHYQQGYKYQEISVILNRPIGTIKSDFSIIKGKLKHLKKYL